MQEAAADQPEPDAGLAASLRERREALAQDASLRARRDELERESAPPAVSLEPEHLEELLGELAALVISRGEGVAWSRRPLPHHVRSLHPAQVSSKGYGTG
jgi:hypothetical protein